MSEVDVDALQLAQALAHSGERIWYIDEEHEDAARSLPGFVGVEWYARGAHPLHCEIGMVGGKIIVVNRRNR